MLEQMALKSDSQTRKNMSWNSPTEPEKKMHKSKNHWNKNRTQKQNGSWWNPGCWTEKQGLQKLTKTVPRIENPQGSSPEKEKNKSWRTDNLVTCSWYHVKILRKPRENRNRELCFGIVCSEFHSSYIYIYIYIYIYFICTHGSMCYKWNPTHS